MKKSTIKKLLSTVLALSMLLSVFAGLGITAHAKTLVDPQYQVTAVANKSEYLLSEVIWLKITFPYNVTYEYDDGTSFATSINAFEYRIDDAEKTNRVTDKDGLYDLYLTASSIGAGAHTITVYAAAADRGVIDPSNSAVVTFTVFNEDETILLNESFERDTIVNSGDIITDSTGVITSATTDKTHLAIATADDVSEDNANFAGTGNFIYNYSDADFTKNTTTAVYTNGNGNVTFALNGVENKGILKFEVDYCYPVKDDGIMPFMPFNLVDSNSNVLRMLSISNAGNANCWYYNNSNYKSSGGTRLGKNIIPFGNYYDGKWHNIKVIYDLDSGDFVAFHDNAMVEGIKNIASTLTGETISAVQYNVWYPNGPTHVMIDNMKVTRIEAAEAEKPVTPPEVKEYTVKNQTLTESEGTAALSVTVKNTTDTDESLYGIIAAYDEKGALANVVIGNAAAVAAGTQESTIQTAQMDLTGITYSTLKGFIWDSVSNMTPLCGAAE